MAASSRVTQVKPASYTCVLRDWFSSSEFTNSHIYAKVCFINDLWQSNF